MPNILYINPNNDSSITPIVTKVVAPVIEMAVPDLEFTTSLDILPQVILLAVILI